MSNRPYFNNPNDHMPPRPHPPPPHHLHQPRSSPVRYYVNIPPPPPPPRTAPHHHCNDDRCAGVRTNDIEVSNQHHLLMCDENLGNNGQRMNYNNFQHNQNLQTNYVDGYKKEYVTRNYYNPNSNTRMNSTGHDTISPNHSISTTSCIQNSYPHYRYQHNNISYPSSNSQIHHTIVRDDRPPSISTQQHHHRPTAVYTIGVQPPTHARKEINSMSSPHSTTALSIEEINKNTSTPQLTPVSVVSTNRSFDSSISSIDNSTNTTCNNKPKSIESIRSEIENDVRNRKASSSHFFPSENVIHGTATIQYVSPTYNQDAEKSKFSPVTCDKKDIVVSPNNIAKKSNKKNKMYSNYIGVTFNKTHGKYQACITHYRKQHYLGRYKLSSDAALAYDKGAKLLKGHGWKINFCSDDQYWAARCKEEQEKLMLQNASPTSASSTPTNNTYSPMINNIHRNMPTPNSTNKRRKSTEAIISESNRHQPALIEVCHSEDNNVNEVKPLNNFYYKDDPTNKNQSNHMDVIRSDNPTLSGDRVKPIQRDYSSTHYNISCGDYNEEQQFQQHSSTNNLINPNDSRDDDNITTPNYYTITNDKNMNTIKEKEVYNNQCLMQNANEREVKALSSSPVMCDYMVEAASVLMTLHKK